MTSIRAGSQHELAAILSLYPAAFPDEELVPLVKALLASPGECQSLGAFVEGQLCGHAVWTACEIDGSAARASLLGPLAVAPVHQGQGIGSALVDAVSEAARDSGYDVMCVLGDPGYYGRFGFTPETGITPPYPLPGEWQSAWQSIHLNKDTAPARGRLVVPGPWRRRELWQP